MGLKPVLKIEPPATRARSEIAIQTHRLALHARKKGTDPLSSPKDKRGCCRSHRNSPPTLFTMETSTVSLIQCV